MVLVWRKLFRLLGVIFPLIYFFHDSLTTILCLSLITCLFLILEISRFYQPQFNRQLFKRFGAVLKQEESGKRISGVSYFLLGSLLTVILFEQTLAITALLFLVFGDAASALVGVKWGRIKIGSKSLEGSLAFFLVCLLIVIILSFTYLKLDLRVGLWGALAATLIELVPLPINDNLSIPLSAALVMTVVT